GVSAIYFLPSDYGKKTSVSIGGPKGKSQETEMVIRHAAMSTILIDHRLTTLMEQKGPIYMPFNV
ncbi:MAG: hypothetical protein ACFFBD_26105, partial [Candidatus Hodarchaeota archaeon]